MIEGVPHATDDKTRLFHPQNRRFDALFGVPEAFCGLSYAGFPDRFRLLTCLRLQLIYERSAALPTPRNRLHHARSATRSRSWFVAASTIIVERTVLTRLSSSNQLCTELPLCLVALLFGHHRQRCKGYALLLEIFLPVHKKNILVFTKQADADTPLPARIRPQQREPRMMMCDECTWYNA